MYLENENDYILFSVSQYRRNKLKIKYNVLKSVKTDNMV